jgi:hypothetical protein
MNFRINAPLLLRLSRLSLLSDIGLKNIADWFDVVLVYLRKTAVLVVLGSLLRAFLAVSRLATSFRGWMAFHPPRRITGDVMCDILRTPAELLMRFLGNNLHAGGTPTSLNYTGEQWDYPNAWPPLQSFLILGLYQTEVKEAVDFAKDLAARWLRSNYIGYKENGNMFEKVNLFFLRRGESVHSLLL